MVADNPAMGQGAANADGGATRTEPNSSRSVRPANPCRRLSEAERIAWYGLFDLGAMSAAEALTWLLIRWRVDPVAFAFEALRVALTPYQAHILLDLADAPLEVYEFYGLDPNNPKRQVLVPSGHGLGKTRVLAIAIWWHKLTHRFSKNIVTAPTADQISGQLWGEIRKLYRRLKKRWPDLANEWEILGASIVHTNPDYSDWRTIARTARVERPEGLQGSHALDADDEFGDLADIFGEEADIGPSGGILIIIEEASGVDDKIRETLEGALSEEGARLLAPGNVTRPDGWFADHLDLTHRYAVHPLDCRMSDRTKTYSLPYRDLTGEVHRVRVRGFVRPQYWEDIIAECDGDEDADRVRVRVRGMKPRSALEQCIRTHWVEQAEGRAPDEASQAEPVVVGLDFGLSSDKHACAVRQGFNVRDVDEWLPKDEPELITLDAVERAHEAVRVHKAKYIVGDSNGVGRGAMEVLTRYYHREHKELGVTVIHFNAGRRADDRRYHRQRDAMWFKYGRPFFADPRCSIPKFPGLKSQLTAAGYHEDTAKRIAVESKDDVKKRTGQASGNAADAVLMTLMVVILPSAPKPKEEAPEHPPAFLRHFARFNRRREMGSGKYIR